jgi:hypothetical protein
MRTIAVVKSRSLPVVVVEQQMPWVGLSSGPDVRLRIRERDKMEGRNTQGDELDFRT